MGKQRFLGLFLLAMLNLSVMTSLRNLPLVAEYGYGSAFFYLLVALVFLIPSTLVSAELATGWTQTGGVYVWVKEAFGPGWGFFAVWMQWIHNVAWFPAILSYSASVFAYIIDPSLAENKAYLICFILGGFWFFTILNYFGLKTSSWFSAIGVVFGTILPGSLLLLLAAAWLLQGHAPEIHFTFNSLIPSMNNVQNLVFLAGLFLAFGGLEVSAAHVREVEHPRKTFPQAIIIAGVVSLILYVLGALAIAIMIPKEEISLVAGLMDAFKQFLNYFHLGWLILPLGLLIILGAVGELNAWVIGPVRALHATSHEGDLPPLFQKLNKHGMPAPLLFFQGMIVTLVSLVFLWTPSASSGFWILSAMSVQIYLLMYILMFLAAIKLRYSHPDVPRPYRIPYRMAGIWTVGLVGVLSSLFAFFIGFIPPSQLQVGNLLFYEGFLIGGIILMCLIPYLIYRYKDPSWQPMEKNE